MASGGGNIKCHVGMRNVSCLKEVPKIEIYKYGCREVEQLYSGVKAWNDEKKISKQEGCGFWKAYEGIINNGRNFNVISYNL